ncbi:GNAT family N-acetyltransferase [uncultured Algimonas sp.]|uniref:GNAT family N-acetyltransferase n=1 Tax=uncultured Algimonas sp. TaxID=1547920 RepID=UPI00263763EE|nr:GNAT family N-acetyltransferase [uncultured Algimonas sp.]
MQETIRTDRLTLRPLRRADAARFSALAGTPEVARMTGSFPSPFPIRSVEGLIDIFRAREATGQAIHRAILSDDRLIGVVGFARKDRSWELGYWIGRPHWGRGFASEAVRAALLAFRGAHPDATVSAGVFTDNPASRRLLLKLGFTALDGLSDSYSLCRDARHPLWRFEMSAVAEERRERLELMAAG